MKGGRKMGKNLTCSKYRSFGIEKEELFCINKKGKEEEGFDEKMRKFI